MCEFSSSSKQKTAKPKFKDRHYSTSLLNEFNTQKILKRDYFHLLLHITYNDELATTLNYCLINCEYKDFQNQLP